jgi:hypothetical protein
MYSPAVFVCAEVRQRNSWGVPSPSSAFQRQWHPYLACGLQASAYSPVAQPGPFFAGMRPCLNAAGMDDISVILLACARKFRYN